MKHNTSKRDAVSSRNAVFVRRRVTSCQQEALVVGVKVVRRHRQHLVGFLFGALTTLLFQIFLLHGQVYHDGFHSNYYQSSQYSNSRNLRKKGNGYGTKINVKNNKNKQHKNKRKLSNNGTQQWSSNTNIAVQQQQRPLNMVELLSNRTTTRYYVYEEIDMNLENITLSEFHRLWTTPITNLSFSDPPEYDFLGTDAVAELAILDALKQHPLRTLNASEAEFYVIPISAAAIKASLMNATLEQQVYQTVFDAILQHPLFQQTHGKRHIMVSTWWGQFEYRVMNYDKFKLDPIRSYYNRLWNITVADMKNRNGINKLYQERQHLDFQPWFLRERIRVTRSGFSVGIAPSPNIPLIEASYEKFHNSTYFLFYHVRPTEFWAPHSTEFRRAAVNDSVIEGLPYPSSIGYSLPKDEWERRFKSSKFCLVVRGDDPSTHALLRAVKAGCIPVVVSDAYPDFAPSMPLSIDMKEYCIFIPEADFIRDPLNELRKLNSLHDYEIHQKMDALRWAQQVLLPDHPDSLFVPAFLREAADAMRTARTEPTFTSYLKEMTTSDKKRSQKALRKKRKRTTKKGYTTLQPPPLRSSTLSRMDALMQMINVI